MQVALRVGGRQGVKEKRTEDGRGGGWYGWDERGGDGWEKVRVGGMEALREEGRDGGQTVVRP